MKVMILAAGRGERMRPLSDVMPKPLLEVRGKPLIVHHLESLVASGFTEIVINVSWLGEQIRKCLGDGEEYGVSIKYSVEDEALETAGGILQALPLLGEHFAVVNGDILTDFNFAQLRRAQADAHLVLVDNPPQHPQGDFTLVDGRVAEKGEPRYTYAGIAAFHRRFFANLASGRQALAPLLYRAAATGRVSGEHHRGIWQDIGTPERLRALAASPEE